MNERLLTAEEVADLLAVPVSWVRESTRSGAIPHVELGRYRRYDRTAVLAWLEACKQPGRAVRLRGGRERAAGGASVTELQCDPLGGVL